MDSPNFGMIKHFNHISFLLLILLILFSGVTIFAQGSKQMFMFQVDGNNYTKKSYDQNGKLKSSQIFKVGEVKKTNRLHTMPLKVYSYDENNKLKGRAVTKYVCKPSAGEIFMSVFPFAEFSVNKTVKIKLNSSNALYPAKWEIAQEIADISFSLSLEGGVLGTFGTSSKILIYDRKITDHDALRNTYTIMAKMQVKAYMFGLRMQTIEFTIEETLHPQKGIVKQYFKESTGDYFTIKLTNR